MKNVALKNNKAVAIDSGAMESGYHLKNGANLKSQTSRGNIFKFFAAVLAACIVLFGCGKDKDNGEVQLLETTTYFNGSYIKNEYDNQNRITKISWYDKDGKIGQTVTLIYSGDDLVKSETTGDKAGITEFVKNGNIITITDKNIEGTWSKTYTIHLDSNGYPTKYENLEEGWSYFITYTIQNGNLMQWTSKEVGYSTVYENSTNFIYDDKKSLFYYCNTPKWYMIYHYSEEGGRNNPIEQSWDGGKLEYKYEYDSAGFPIKRTIIYDNEESAEEKESTSVTTYEYIFK